jgi:hypothetical protein
MCHTAGLSNDLGPADERFHPHPHEKVVNFDEGTAEFWAANANVSSSDSGGPREKVGGPFDELRAPGDREPSFVP